MAADVSYPDLEGKVVLVTGGASGIGAAITRRFAQQRARIAFLDIAEAPARALVDDLKPAAVLFEHCDLTDIAALRRSIAAVKAKLGPIQVLVNNAAHDDRHALESVTPEYWDDRIAVNLKHQFFAAQAVAPDMIAAKGGSIINFGSVSWMNATGGMPAYTAAKAAVHGMTRSLARDLGPHGIRANTVVPGWIMTERQLALWVTPEAKTNLLARQCLKTTLVPDDVARMVLFLASDQAAACTAQNYVVDGGLT